MPVVDIANIVDFNAMIYKIQYNDSSQVPDLLGKNWGQI